MLEAVCAVTCTRTAAPHFTIFPGDAVEVMECLPLPQMERAGVDAEPGVRARDCIAQRASTRRRTSAYFRSEKITL